MARRRVPRYPGCISQGKMEQKALQNTREAIQLCLEVRQETGRVIINGETTS